MKRLLTFSNLIFGVRYLEVNCTVCLFVLHYVSKVAKEIFVDEIQQDGC